MVDRTRGVSRAPGRGTVMGGRGRGVPVARMVSAGVTAANRSSVGKLGLGGVIKWENFRVYCGDSAGDEVIPTTSKWLSGAQVPGYLVHVEIVGCHSAQFELQTAMGIEGPWKQVAAYTGITASTVLVSSEGDGALLAGLLRWKLTGTAANWKACFRVGAIPKTK
jgi:hypothetical protein